MFEITEIFVLPDSVIQDVLHAYHDSSHYGIARLAESIRRRYYFEKMSQRIRTFVRNCPVCAKGKTHLPPKSNLGENVVAMRPGQIFLSDIVVGLSTTKKNNRYILTIQDLFSRYIFLYAIPDMTSETIAEKMLLCFSQSGLCDLLITDFGSNFVGSLMTKLYALLGIKKAQGFPYVPRCLGPTDRAHRTLGASLRCMLLETKDLGLEWDDLLPTIEFAFRSACNPDTKLCPFDLWLGRPVKWPIDVSMGSIDDVGASSADEYVTSVRRRLDIMYNLQQVIEAKSRKEMIERYARTKARPYEFDKGHLVYLNNPVPRDG